MAPAYFTLAVRRNGKFEIEFGDYDRDCVAFELDDLAQHKERRADMKIVKSADDQGSIERAVQELNR